VHQAELNPIKEADTNNEGDTKTDPGPKVKKQSHTEIGSGSRLKVRG
jgi:hypothetical protein